MQDLTLAVAQDRCRPTSSPRRPRPCSIRKCRRTRRPAFSRPSPTGARRRGKSGPLPRPSSSAPSLRPSTAPRSENRSSTCAGRAGTSWGSSMSRRPPSSSSPPAGRGGEARQPRDHLAERGRRRARGSRHQDRSRSLGFGRCLEEVGAGFLFAPLYHPAFKAVAPVRARLGREGKRTIFNLLGPLLNPARPGYQLIGVFDPAIGPAFARILPQLGREAAWVVHGTTETGSGMDELSTLGPRGSGRAGERTLSSRSSNPLHSASPRPRPPICRGATPR